jgi:hypothetical protein
MILNWSVGETYMSNYNEEFRITEVPSIANGDLFTAETEDGIPIHFLLDSGDAIDSIEGKFHKLMKRTSGRCSG